MYPFGESWAVTSIVARLIPGPVIDTTFANRFFPGANPLGAKVPGDDRTIVGVVDWDLSMQQAIDVPHLIASSPVVRQEATASPEVVRALQARGWNLRQSEAEDSGLHGFVVTQRGIDAGADPRREGAVVRVRR